MSDGVLTVGELFAGIGGFGLAAERAGLRVAWQSEIDPYASAVLRKHWDVPNHGDIRDMRGADVEPVDIVTAGFPCQPVSLAGKQLGVADERWMWPETIRIVREARPRWFVGENVRGLLSADSGRLYGTILRDLDASGYVAEWDCIPATAVGAPHIRDRVWIVAYTKSNIWGTSGDEGPTTSDWRSPVMANATSNGRQSWRPSDTAQGPRGRQPNRSHLRPRIFSNTDSEPMGWPAIPRQECDFWTVEPDVGRVADGIPRRVDRLRGLGSAIVPQIAEWIFHRILDHERSIA